MIIDDMDSWNFEPELVEGCEIECPECNEYSIYSDWSMASVPCEDCGEHSAIRCPKCDTVFDHVWSPTFKTRII